MSCKETVRIRALVHSISCMCLESDFRGKVLSSHFYFHQGVFVMFLFAEGDFHSQQKLGGKLDVFTKFQVDQDIFVTYAMLLTLNFWEDPSHIRWLTSTDFFSEA